MIKNVIICGSDCLIVSKNTWGKPLWGQPPGAVQGFFPAGRKGLAPGAIWGHKKRLAVKTANQTHSKHNQKRIYKYDRDRLRVIDIFKRK